MSEEKPQLFRVKFINNYTRYNAGEIAGFTEAFAKKITGGARPPAILIDKLPEKKDPSKPEKAQPKPKKYKRR